ncbi:MAG: asparaginase [Aeromicrobium sp.]
MEVLAEVVRSGLIESRHRGVVVRVDADGEVVWSIDDPGTVVFPRSANKPIQALGMLRAGLPLDGKLLAIAAASHSGEPFHLDAVRQILALAGLDESALQTPPSYPLDPKVHADYIRAGGVRAPICMDCSGKHAAMLLTCVTNDWPTDTYLDPEHPLQVVITETFTELTEGVPSVIGIDGCGAPLLATPLVQLARAVGRIAAGAPGTPEAKLAAAMKTHPEYVSGTNRAELALVRAFPDLLAKSGAESVYIVAQPDGEAFALKIEDGGERPLYAVMGRALELAGLSAPVLMERPQVLGGGQPVGEVRTTF